MAKKRANGEGSIRKRSDGRWEGRYTAGYDPKTGKRITKNVLGKTQAEVKEKLAKAIEESKKLDVVRSDEYTVAEWLRLWYELYAKPNIRPTTADSYHRGIESHVIPRIGEIKLKELTSRDIQKLYKDLQENGRLRKSKKQQSGLSNATVRGIHMMLHNALDRAVKERLILRNPTEDCIIPKIQKQEMKILHPEDMKAYLEEYPAFETAINQLNDTPANNYTAGVLSGVQTESRLIFNEIIPQLYDGSLSPQDAVDSLASQVNAAVENYNASTGTE